MLQQLVDFIEEYLHKGSTKDEIRSVLLRVGGWSPEEVDQAFSAVDKKNPTIAEAVPVKPIAPPTPKPFVPNIPPKPQVPSYSPAVVSKPQVQAYSPMQSNNINRPPVMGFQTSTPSSVPSAPKPSTGFKTISPALPPKPLTDIRTLSASSIPKSSAIMQRPPMEMYTHKSPTSNKILSVALISISILVLAGAGGAFAYFYYFSGSPDDILWKAVDNFQVSENFDFNSESKAEISGLINSNDIKQLESTGLVQSVVRDGSSTTEKVKATGTLTLKQKGSVDIENSKLQSEISLSVDGSASGMRFGATVDLEFRFLDKNFYAILKTFPEIGMDLSSIKNVWLVSGVEQTLSQISSETDTAEQLTKNAEVYAKFKELKVITVSEKLANENIGGVSSYHYKISLNRGNLRNFIIEASRIQGATIADGTMAEFDKFLDNISTEGEVWIGKSDNRFYKLLLKATGKLPEVEGDMVLSSVSEFSNYDQPKTVLVPSPVKPIEEVMSAFFGNMSQSGNLEFNLETPPLPTPIPEPTLPTPPPAPTRFIND